MAKYNEKLIIKIIRLFESDICSISEICDTLDINRKTFYEWRKTKPEFDKKVKDCIKRRDEAIFAMIKDSMKRKREAKLEQ